jgi:ribose transport system permease protein
VLAYIVAVVMFLLPSAFSPGFASPSHVRELVIEASFIGIVGLGQTFVILGGGVDLSIPWVLNAVASLMAVLANGQNAPLVWVLPLVLGLATLVGLCNGIGVAVFGISPIIMTLGMNVIVEGALLVYMGGTQPSKAPTFISGLALNNVGPIPVDPLIWAGLTLLATIALSWTGFGRRLYAVGTSRMVSEFSGVNVVPVLISTYVVSALAAAIAGILYTGFIDQAYLGMGDPYLFASAAAVAVGGASILGGDGHYVGTIAGALVLTLLQALLLLFSLGTGYLMISYGAVLLIAAFFASLKLARR